VRAHACVLVNDITIAMVPKYTAEASGHRGERIGDNGGRFESALASEARLRLLALSVTKRSAVGPLVLLVALSLSRGTVSTQAADEREAQAQRMLRTGLAFLDDRNYAQATRELTTIAELYKTTTAAPVACLRLAEYYLDVERHLANAGKYLDQLTKEHATSSSAAMGYVLSGRVKLLQQGTKGINDALGEFKRAQEYFEHHPDVAAAKYFEAETLSYTGNVAEAVAVYRQVSLAYPNQVWAARALLGEARSLVTLGQGARALDVLQRVRDRFSNTTEATTAGHWSAIVYRLYLRAQPPFRFANRTIPIAPEKLRDIDVVAAGPGEAIHAAGNAGVFVYDARTGKARPGPGGGTNIRALLFDRSAVFTVQKGQIVRAGGTVTVLKHRKGSEPEKPLEDISAAVMTSRGDLIVADRDQKAIFRFSATGAFLQRIDSTAVDRLAIDARDRMAALDSDAGSVVLLAEDGRSVGRATLQSSSTKVVDLAFDPLGHLYLLDRKAGAVWIHAPGDLTKPLMSFAVADKQPGTFRRATAFGLDAAGRLYVYDESAERMQVYQ
jgi:TolA-binding protein